MKQKILTLLLAFMPLMASADESGTCGDNLTWTYEEATQTLTITGEGAMPNFNGDYYVPWKSFWDQIKIISLDSRITSIGNHAFSGCSGLTSITIPDGVTSIGDAAFRGCSSLTSITIPDGVTSIGLSTFDGCSGLTSITIGKSVTSIGSNAFYNCTSLEEVYIYAENFLSSSYDIFSNSPINQAVLYAPAIHLNSYRESSPWSNFKYIFPIEGSYAERCAKPTISIKDGEIVFECETPDASYVTSYEILNSSTTTDNKMSLPNRFRISVYAQKYGLLDSPVATAEVETNYGKRGDLNDDGVLNAADVVKLTNMIMNQE